VRGRAAELQDRLDPAQVDYEAALKTDEAFVPALSRLWRVFDRKGSKADALATLERLYRLNALTADEKVALARLDADTWANVQRGRALIDEALKRDPQNAEYRAIKARLARSAAKPAGVVIMKGR
jgi:tetratricopeptide (TPR) repeat protein